MRTRLALASLLCIAPVAMAQRLSGTVRSSAPPVVSGAVLTIVDAAGQTLARTLSDAAGRYSLAVAPTAARLRAVKIGFRPLTVEIKRSDADFRVDLTLERAP